jgi:Tol biopolymer transport system component
MGEVYRARDTRLGRDVALKVLPDDLATDPDRLRRFEHEARMLASLNHPNVAAVYGLEDGSGRVALVMELVPGLPLSERIGPQGLPPADAVRLAVQIAAGLEAAHAMRIVHRDLKPANILVTSSGSVKLVDFGVAKLIERPRSTPLGAETLAAPAETEPGLVLGTVGYMSPEQARGDAVDARSDLFSFGAVLYEMLTGRRPFDGEDRFATLSAVLHRDPTPPSDIAAGPIPRELERLVLRCLRKDRERRTQSASDLKLALEDLAEDLGSGIDAVQPRAGRQVPRSRWAWAAVAASLVALGAVLAAYLASGRRAAAPPPVLRQVTFESGVAITPALSPDGQLLAYATDRSGEGQLDIWLKQVAGGEPVRLTNGPDSKVNPQFSPEGTRIYFLGDRGSVFEVPTLGGASRKLLDAAGPFSVSSRGDIVFHRPGTGTSPGPMFVLPAGAGSAEPWHPECASIGAPVWSPDGARIAFVGMCGPFEPFVPRSVEIRVGPREGGPTTLIGTSAVGASAPRVAWAVVDRRDVLLGPQRTGDSSNLYRFGFDGSIARVTQGTGLESWPVASSTGALLFSRSELTPAVWSLPLTGQSGAPRKEASPARMFAASRDASLLAYGRMLGIERGQLVLRDRARDREMILGSHAVRLGGGGSFWPQVSPDTKRVVYRVNGERETLTYVVSTDGGAPRPLAASKEFSLASDWAPDGRRVIGECMPPGRGVCELDPDADRARLLLAAPAGEQLLYPSYSWDGRWLALMRRRAQGTVATIVPVDADGSFAAPHRWIAASPEDADAQRPRFAPDGASLFYHLTRGNVTTLVRQALDPVTMQPSGDPVAMAPILSIPQSVFNIALQHVISVTNDRVYFNTAEIRSNVWMTRLE